MKARIVLVALLVSMMVIEVSAQRAEYDDMYFRGKDREKNKAIDAEEAYASAKTTKNKKQKPDEVFVEEEEEENNVNPTDSYSARNVNPEYVSRSNSEKASEDEANYYLEGYTAPTASSTSNFNNSYYNDATLANTNYYLNNSLGSPYYGSCACNSYMNPAYGYGYGPTYGMGTGWSVTLTYGNYWSPYGGYGNPYYGGYGSPYYGGYGYPNYYGGNNYYEAPRVVNYGKRPSRHSAIVQTTQRTRTRDTGSENVSSVNTSNRLRQRQTQDEYYVRPSRRTSTLGIDNLTQRNSGNTGNGNDWFTPSAQPSRSRESYNPPSYTPSSSPSPSRGGNSGGSGGGGSSSPRPRGRN
jgi:hypothetical protein